MTIAGVVSAFLMGLLIGALGGLALPGKQPIPVWLAILVGIAAAFLGSGRLELLLGGMVATVGVVLASAAFSRRRSGIQRRF